MSDFDYECYGESIDGIWHGCGCEDCSQAEADAIEADVECGAISETDARAMLAAIGYADEEA